MPATASPLPLDALALPSPAAGWWRARLTLGLGMLAIALCTGWQYWQARRAVDDRVQVAQATRLTMQALRETQRIGSVTTGLLRGLEPGAVDASGGRNETAAASRQTLQQALDALAAQALGPAVSTRQAREAGASRAGQAWQQWRDESAVLVRRTAALIDALRVPRAEYLRESARPVVAQAERAAEQAGVLLGLLQDDADASLDRQAHAMRWGSGLTLAVLVLSLVVVVPVLRRLQTQARRTARRVAESERLALVAECTNNTVLITDQERRIAWANAAFSRASGYALEDVIGRRPREFLLEQAADPLTMAALHDALSHGRAAQATMLHRTRTGEPYWVAFDMQPLRNVGGELTGFISVGTVITEQIAQRTRAAAVMAALPTAVVVHGPGGDVREANPAAAALLGVRVGDRADALLQRAPVAEDAQALAAADLPVQRCLSQGRGEHGRVLAVAAADGEGGQRWLLANVELLVDALGRLDGAVACYVDITERRRLLEQMHDAAVRDPLTRLGNRQVVLERVQRAIEHRRANPAYGFAVLFMDVDRFKQVNDTLGHAAGDDLLCQVAGRIEETVRPGDAVARVDSQIPTAARLGGDEFVIVLEGVRQPEEASTVAERLLQALSRPYRLGAQTVHVSVSIGIVTVEHAAEDAGAVLRDCDTAMYEAKRAGRGCSVVFDASMRERLRAAVEMEGDLRVALARSELDVAYQPVVDLVSRRLLGVEALARWRHPVRGEVPPLEFIALAEECGLIDDLGAQILGKACAQFALWREHFGKHAPALLAVNLSRAQLRQPGLVPEVQAALQASGMRPEQLQLEVTESFAAQDVQVQATLRALKGAGVRLALDDFGTGYSSLACLHQLPVDTVKIDRSFVAHAHEVEYHRVLISATIRVARALGMATVAEGIETPAQADLMVELECDRGQGWLFGRPLRAEAFARWLEESRVDTVV